MAITSLEELEKLIDLREDERSWNEDGKNTLPLLISDNIASLISYPEIRRQFVPSREENTDTVGTLDPQNECIYSVTPRLVRRYHNRAAFLVTDKCFAYCRHCFRRRFSGHLMGVVSKEELEEVTSFLSSHSEINEVLITGGDLFTLSDGELSFLLSSLKKARKDIIYRLCTRSLLSAPERFTPALFKIIEENNYGAPFYLMTQFNSAVEITEKAKEAVKGFVKLGIPIMNQSVLLMGVNDSLEEQKKLSRALLENCIKPYYLFQGDLVEGTRHLRVPLSKGLELEREMRKELSGLEMPVYTIDLPDGGGKVPLSGNYLENLDDGIWTILTPDGEKRHYPD